MAWTDTKQAAADPDNPLANEQIPVSEWNDMVNEIWNRIIGKAVDDTAIGNDKILIYKTATSTFVFESQSAVAALASLSDVTISGVPADNELLAYDHSTSEWINQTAAEAGIVAAADLAAYLPLAGGTLSGVLDVDGNAINGTNAIVADTGVGTRFQSNAGTLQIILATDTYAYMAYGEGNMNGHRIFNVADPTSAQDASTKHYADGRLFGVEANPTFTDGRIPVFRTASGKFEMELISIDLSAMTGDLGMDGHNITGVDEMHAHDGTGICFQDSSTVNKIDLADGTYAYKAYSLAHMGNNRIMYLADPVMEQDAVTRAYSDSYLAQKQIALDYSDGYVLVYRTASGKFEMEASSASMGLPVVDTTAIVKGSSDGTKLVRFEADGLTTGTTRVMTIPDKDMVLCDRGEVMLLDGSQDMTADLIIDGYQPRMSLKQSGTLKAAIYYQPVLDMMILESYDHGSATSKPFRISASEFDLAGAPIKDMKNDAATALSGTQRDVEMNINGTAYYFTVYPTKA